MCLAYQFCAQFSTAVNMYQLPGVPTGLTFVPSGNEVLRATWIPPSYTGGQTQPLDYQVQIDGAVVSVGNSTAYATVLYSAGTNHTILVRSVNYAGPSVWSAAVTNISLFLPSAPTTVTASIAGEGVIDVSFGLPAVTGLSSSTWPIQYYVMRIHTAQTSYLNTTVSSAAMQASVTGLTKGVIYTFVVSAVNWAGEGAADQASQVAMYSASAPTELTTNTTEYSEQLQVSWGPPADVGDTTNNSFRILNYSVVLYRPNTPACVYSTTGTELLTSAVRVSQTITAGKTLTYENLQPGYCVSVTVSAINAASRNGALGIVTAVPQLLNFRQSYVNLSTNLTGTIGIANFTFVTYSPLAGEDKFLVIFPPTLSLPSANLNYASQNFKSVSASFRAQMADPSICGYQCSPTPAVLLSRVDGIASNPGSLFQISLSGVQNPAASSAVGTFQIKTLRSNSNYLIDASLAVLSTPSQIVPDRVDATITLSNPRAGAVGYLAVDLTCAVSTIPPQVVISVVLGERLQQTGSAFTVLTDSCPGTATGPWVSCLPPMTGSLKLSSAVNGVVTILRTGGTFIPAGQKVRFILSGIQNPQIPGSTGSFQVILNNTAGVFALNVDIDPVFIWPMSSYALASGGSQSNLNAVQVLLSSYISGGSSIVSLVFTAGASLVCAQNRDGQSVIVQLPDSFQPISEPNILLVTSPASLAYAFLLGSNRSEPCTGPAGETCLGISNAQCFPRTWLTCWFLTFQFYGCAESAAQTTFNLTFGVVQNGIESGNVSFGITIANSLWSASNVTLLSSVLSQVRYGPLQIVPNTLLEPSVQAQSALCGSPLCGTQLVNSIVPIIIAFKTATDLPVNFSLLISFGSGAYSVPGTLSILPIGQTMATDGNWTIQSLPSSQGLNVIANRSGYSNLMRLSVVSLNISGLLSQSVSGSSGTYSFYVASADGSMIELNTAVPAVYFQYPVPVVSQFQRCNGPTTGGVSISIMGSYFGPVDANPRLGGGILRERVGLIGSSTCQSTTWTSDSSLSCITSSGISPALKVGLTIEDQTAMISRPSTMGLFSVDAPSVARASIGGNSSKTGTNSPTLSGLIVLTGADYGLCDFTPSVQVVSACSSTTWTSDSVVSCRMAQGFLSGQDVSITVGVSTGSLTDALSFDVPVITSMNNSNARATGGSSISLTGLDFGFYDSSSRMRMGYTACQASVWTSDSSMTCTIPSGFYQSLTMTLSVGNDQVATMPLLWSYDMPIILSSAVVSDPTSDILTLDGINFGVWDNTIQADIGQLGCATTSWISDSSVLCALKPPLTASNVSSFELQTAVAQSYICRNCVGSEGNFLVGCEVVQVQRPRTADLGTCMACQSCPPGFNRVGCDTDSRLRCVHECKQTDERAQNDRCTCTK